MRKFIVSYCPDQGLYDFRCECFSMSDCYEAIKTLFDQDVVQCSMDEVMRKLVMSSRDYWITKHNKQDMLEVPIDDHLCVYMYFKMGVKDAQDHT